MGVSPLEFMTTCQLQSQNMPIANIFPFQKMLILCLVLDCTEMTIYVSDNGILNVHAL